MRPYSEAVKADVRRRMGPPHRQSVADIAQELGIHPCDSPAWWISAWSRVRRRLGRRAPT